MMGRREDGQGQFFYAFDLDKVVPPDHLVRQIEGVLDLSWVHKELAPYYSHTGRPSIDPALMIRMLIVGYAFAIRSERRICAEVRVNLAYRWFCKLGIEDKIPQPPNRASPMTKLQSSLDKTSGQRHADNKRCCGIPYSSSTNLGT
jgi:transposase